MEMLNRIRGSLLGGAMGDALGYAVEFERLEDILRKHGEQGITHYVLRNGVAQISDDTQMTLFTANGLLLAKANGEAPRSCVAQAYLDWYKTQCGAEREGRCFLLREQRLHVRRAPGNTCLCALAERTGRETDFIRERLNDSKGCGGIMRVAPLALLCREETDGRALALEGAQLAAITHGHSLGYMPAAVVTYLLHALLNGESDLYAAVEEAKEAVCGLFAGDEHLQELKHSMDLAVSLSKNEKEDRENLRALGEGWVAEETLAVALYCTLRYREDFSKALTVSVNHSGDSDSTGAVTGNLLGAYTGYAAIEDRWKENLELSDLLLLVAEDLYAAGLHDGGNESWMERYRTSTKS